MILSKEKVSKILNLPLNTSRIEFDNLGKLNSKNGNKILSYLDNEKFIPELKSNNLISSIFTTKEIDRKMKEMPAIISKNPKYDFCRFQNYLVSKTNFYREKISWSTTISRKAIIKSSNISSDLVAIGDSTEIGSGCTINSCVKIGKNVKISSNVILGEDGAEIATHGNDILRFSHGGGLIIEDDVSLQSAVSIKKGLFGFNTKISKGCTIGSFVNVGHHVKLGKNCFVAPGSIIAGGVEIGDDCYLGVNCTILHELKIGKKCQIGAGSIVTKDIPANKVVFGSPAKIIRDNV